LLVVRIRVLILETADDLTTWSRGPWTGAKIRAEGRDPSNLAFFPPGRDPKWILPSGET
jgi:hypothetical protein